MSTSETSNAPAFESTAVERVPIEWERSDQENASLVKRLRKKFRWVRSNAVQARYRLKLRYQYYLGSNQPERPVFILSEGRSGSNLIVDYFRSVPEVSCTEEVLNARDVIGLRNYMTTKSIALRHIKYSLAMPGRVSVVKLASHHMKWHGITSDDLCEYFPESRMIILYRRDLLKQYVSWRKLYLTGSERHREGRAEHNQAIHVDPEQFREFCLRVSEQYSTFSQCQALRERSCVVAYEELADDPQGVFEERIFPLLGIPATPIATSMKKQSKGSLEEQISNFEELQPLLADPITQHHFEWGHE
ncbi:MAG: hypothetical protein KDA52_11645 [Planctomycetaceae bacterium]|nr:hypothetical protein [Planctomycetaceae bacterium]